MLKIPERISVIESMIPKSSVCADIGTDHGYLPIALGHAEKCEKIIATDISETCLKKAVGNIGEQGFNCFNVEYRIGDGIKTLRQEDCVSHIVIAGMGGRQIIEMLAMLPDYLYNTVFIVQPMQNIIELRQALQGLDCCISREELVYENNRYFEIIEIRKINHTTLENCCPVQNQMDALFGPYLIKNRHPLLLARAQEILEMHVQTTLMIEKSASTAESKKRAAAFNEQADMIRRLIYELQHSDNQSMG